MRFAAVWASAGLALLSWAGGAGAAGAGVPRDLEALMARLAGSDGVVAEFRQRKELALLEAPIESRGTMHFVPPRCLAWITTHPGASRLLIEGESVRFQDATNRGEIDLSRDLIARAFVESFVVLFGGDHEAMKRQYEIAFDSGDEGWTLVLTPRSARMRDFVARIELQGRDGPVERMLLLEAGGDKTTTTFESVEVDRALTPEETLEIFGSKAACSGP